MRIAFLQGEFLFQRQDKFGHGLTHRLQIVEVTPKARSGRKFARTALVESVEHKVYLGTWSAGVGPKLRDCFHERSLEILHHCAHQLGLEFTGRSEVVQNIGVRHTKLIGHGLERHGVRTAVNQEFARYGERFAHGLRRPSGDPGVAQKRFVPWRLAC